MRCPSCGASVPSGARFCPACGAPVTARLDERRIVTVLFGDVVGFTSLSEARDPERVKHLLDRCFERLAEVVTSFGGRVDKIIGDAMVALFGAPVTHEDDAERAVRAALRMQEVLEEFRQGSGGELEMRIGVNTGEVLVGALRAGGDYTAMGDVVNTASRLQAAARPGQVLVGPTTYGATREVIEYEACGSLQAKGREEPVEVWEARRPVGPPGVRPRRSRSPLVGRSTELGLLWHALGTMVEHRRPHVVLLVGEAGVGKTRIAEEAAKLARDEHGAVLLDGRCVPYGEGNVWWPIADILHGLCGIDPSDPGDEAVRKCREAVAGLVEEKEDPARTAEGLLYFMGYGTGLQHVDPARARAEAVRAVCVAIGALAARHPVAIVISELHWAADVVLELIDELLDRLTDLPLVLIGTARPEIQDRWVPRPGRYNLMVVNLDPLDRGSAERLLRSLGPEIPPELRETIIERSGGNPLFLEELAALLEEAPGRLSEHARTSEAPLDLPVTLRGLVSARLDGLSAQERNTLEDAAVGGRTAPLEALEALARERGVQDPSDVLDSLAKKDLLAFIGEEYTFKSDLVRDVAYETLSKAERARRHAALAGWLEAGAQEGGREEEYLERIAFHYGTGAELATELGDTEQAPVLRQRALEWLRRAAARAEERETPGMSLHLYAQALRLADTEETPERWELMLGRAKANAALRELGAAREDAEHVAEGAQRAGDLQIRGRALIVLGDVTFWEGDYEESAATLDRAARLCREAGDTQGEAEALRRWGMASLFRGETPPAEEAITRSLDAFRAIGDRRGEAWCLQNLAWIALVTGDFETAEAWLRRSMDLFSGIGDFGGMGWAVGLLGYVSFAKGDLSEAEAIAEGGVDYTVEMGDRWAEGMMINLLAGVRLWRGRTQEAVALGERATELFRSMGDAFGEFQSTLTLSTALVLVGRISEAFERAERWLPLEGSLPAGMGGGASLLVADLASKTGDGYRAVGMLQVPDENPLREEQNEFRTSVGAIGALQLGRATEAVEALEPFVNETLAQGGRSRIMSVLAIAYACAGRVEDALACARELEDGRERSYQDVLYARVGAGLAHARGGAGAEAERAFRGAVELVEATDDLLHRAVARLARGYALRMLRSAEGEQMVEEARDRLAELGAQPEGWGAAFALAVAVHRP